jgi:Ca-activated chloride channel family protein
MIKRIFSVILCLIIITACQTKETLKGKDETEEPQQDLKLKNELAKDAKEMINQGPGKYSGDKYNEAKVNAELDKIPDNATKEQAFNAVMDLLAEDYPSILNFFRNFDPEVTFDFNHPDSEINAPNVTRYNVAVLLDASGSMAAQINGEQKMDIAKAAVQSFVSSVPVGSNISLIVYGHKGSNSEGDKSVSCKAIEEVYPLGIYERSRFSQVLNEVSATGWTPLADAIKKSGSILEKEQQGNVENLVYVVSDGIETCGGDPVIEAKGLNNSGIKATVNIIGFDVNNSEQQALKKVAQAGGGSYFSANSKRDLERYFQREYNRILHEWGYYENDLIVYVGSQGTEKQKQLINAMDKCRELRDLERSRVEKAIKYLEEKKQITGLLPMQIDRGNKIYKLFSDSYSYFDNKRQNSVNQAIQIIRREVQENKNIFKDEYNRD